jgi:hypothetical protein
LESLRNELEHCKAAAGSLRAPPSMAASELDALLRQWVQSE